MIKTASRSAVDMIREFLKLESAGGLLLVGAAVLSMLLANSPLSSFLSEFLQSRLIVTYEGYGIDKPLLYWINDGLMAMFFLMVGLELKREVVEGQLSSADQVMLPAVAAVGGLVVPAGDEVALARAMEWLYDHPDERKRMGIAARDRIGGEFHSDDTVRRTMALYREVMSE